MQANIYNMYKKTSIVMSHMNSISHYSIQQH